MSIYSETAPTVCRYAVTHIHHDGTRRLTLSANGSATWATGYAADEWLEAFLANNSEDRLRDIYGEQALGTFRVRLIECWAGHFDPCATVYPKD